MAKVEFEIKLPYMDYIDRCFGERRETERRLTEFFLGNLSLEELEKSDLRSISRGLVGEPEIVENAETELVARELTDS